MELLDAPAEISSASFQISVQMLSTEIGPYACLVYHDAILTPLTLGELQQQFSGPYTDFTTDQVTQTFKCALTATQDMDNQPPTGRL